MSLLVLKAQVTVEDRDNLPASVLNRLSSKEQIGFGLSADVIPEFEYNASKFQAGSPFTIDREARWLMVRYDVDAMDAQFYQSDEQVLVKRYRVKPWSRRWWKPWDSVEEYLADETVWEEL